MAFVVARPSGRFEIRESSFTVRGPRSSSLVGFRVLDAATMQRAEARASKHFDRDAVIASARRAGATFAGEIADLSPSERDADDRQRPEDVKAQSNSSVERFLAASKKMAQRTELPVSIEDADRGAALIELLAFADAIGAGARQSAREPLAFPALAQLPARAI